LRLARRAEAMGKKQHSKDKMYVLQSEWQYEGMSGGRGYAGGKGNAHKLPFRCLPFHCCALSLSPFQDPMMTPKVQILKSERSAVAL
jgi:peptidyl-prolyl cis-trans isomerase-like 2